MTADITGILFNLICCIMPILFLIGIAFAIYFTRRNPSNSQPTPPQNNITGNILSILRDLKAKGFVTIDEAISFYEKDQVPVPAPQPKVEVKDIPVKQEVQKTIEVPAAPIPQRPEMQINSAEILLYLGSFLITFAMLVLVALGWTTIPGIVKTIVLVATVLAFYIGGLFLIRNEKLKKVGVTYLTVASLATPLAFLGIWNFSLNQNLMSFSLYWTIVSIIVIVVNVLLSNLVAKKRFFYLLQIAIYSLFISFAFTLTDDNNFRIVIISVLNLFFYLSDRIFGNYSKEVKYISRAVNFVLNFVILFAVIGLLPQISTDYQKVLASLALLIPTIFIAITYLRDRAYLETGLEFIILIPKIFLINAIFALSPENYFLVFGLTSILYVLFAEFDLYKKTKALFYEALGIALTIIGAINFYIAVLWITPEAEALSNASIVFLILSTLFVLLFIPLKRKLFSIAGVGLLYLIFAYSRIFGFFIKGGEFSPYIYSYLIAGIALGSALIYGIKYKKDLLVSLIRPLAEILPVVAMFSVFLKPQSSEITIVFFAFSLLYFIRSLILKTSIEKFVSYTLLLVGYIAFLFLLRENKVATLNTPQDFSIAILFISIALFVFSEIRNYFKLDNLAEDYGVTLFSTFGLILSFFDEKVAWINLALITVFFAFRFSYRLSKVLLTLIYILSQVLIILGLNIYNKSTENTFWILTFVNMALLIISTFINISPRKVISEKIASLLKYFSTLVAIFVILLTISSIGIGEKVLWTNLLTLFIYSLLKVFELKSKGILVFSFILLQALVVLGANILKLEYIDTILAVSISTLIVATISKVSQLFKESQEANNLSKYLNILNYCAMAYTFLLFALTGISAIFGKSEIYSVIFAVQAFTLLLSNQRFIQKLSGVIFIALIWNLNHISDLDLNIQFYIVPITLYGLVLAGLSHLEGRKKESEVLETSSYTFQMLTLLYQSVISTTDMENLVTGIVLIGLSVILILLGLFRSKKSIWIVASVFLFLELLIRFYVVIVLLPWWIYVGLVGIGLIALASYIIYRNTK